MGNRRSAEATFPGAGYPCSSVCVQGDMVIGGFTTGHVRLFSRSAKALVVEVAAHARAINAVASDLGARGTFASAGEDGMVDVWKWSGEVADGAAQGKEAGGAGSNGLSVRLMITKELTDRIITGLQYMPASGTTSLIVSGFDYDKISQVVV